MHILSVANGTLWRHQVGASSAVQQSLPGGVSQVVPFVRPDSALFQGLNRQIFVGQWNQTMVWVPNLGRLVVAGLPAPVNASTLAASGTGITGIAIGVVTYADIDNNGNLLVESNPGPNSNSLTLTNQGRQWTGLPTTCPNPRATHIRLYVSMDGSAFEFVAQLPLGTATYTENVATAALGQSVAFTHGVPPYAKYVTVYQRRMWYADGTDTFYFSEIDGPEYVQAVSSLKTTDGRNITCLKGLTDALVFMSRRSLSDLQGYGPTDFRLRVISQDVGCISHYAAKVINDMVWFPTQFGYMRYGGAGLQFLMGRSLRTYFRKQYEANPGLYQDAQASVDERYNVLRVLIPGPSAFYYVAHYLPCETTLGGNGEPPFWTFDIRTRKDYSVGALTNGSLFDTQYTGSCDGYVRAENVDSDPGDDGDSYQKMMTLASKHFFMSDQSGDDIHGHTVVALDIFMVSEQVAWTPALYCGDDDAYSSLTPSWTPNAPIPPSAQSLGPQTSTKKTSHHFEEVPGAGGKGATIVITIPLPVGVEFRGYGLEWQGYGENVRGQAT